MKKIALISDGWKRLVTYAWIIGIMEEIRKTGAQVSIFQFNSHGNWSKDSLHNQGEYNIYTLVNLQEYDGVILDLVNTPDETVCKWVIEMVRKSGVPTVSIGRRIEGFYYVGVDNEGTVEELIDHLYEVHHCRRFVFAGGPAENWENQLREKAYKKCMKERGLSLEENPVWSDTFEFDTGVRYFNKVISRGAAFPDVFVCANDNIAAGIIITAKKMGYRIPRDFLVTGFDNLDKAIYFEPQITTVSQKRESIGGRSMRILLDLWEGKDLPFDNFIGSKCIYSESCGCPSSTTLNYRQYIMDKLISEIDKQRNDEELVIFENDITDCKTYDEIFEKTARYFTGQNCDGFSIVVDKGLYEGIEESEFPTMGYDFSRMHVAFCTVKDQVLDFATVEEMKQFLENSTEPEEYMFSPIHFRDKVIGFTILKNGKFLFDNPYYYDMMSLITKTIYRLYQRLQIERINQKMLDIYNRDQLTGLYNRIAYSEMIEPKFESYQKEGKHFVLAFVDADNFKQINDIYGHKRGDEILIRIAQVLNQFCPKEGYTYRFGGDEFSVFFPCEERETGKNFKDLVVSELAKEEISVSIGIVVTDPKANRGLDYYMLLADQDMYREKQIKKS